MRVSKGDTMESQQKIPQILGNKLVWGFAVIWSRWCFGVEFLAFPWWGSLIFGPLELHWHREPVWKPA